jgi:hypothetical protein
MTGWEAGFLVANASVIPAWALLVVAPGWRGTAWVHTVFPFALIGVAYLLVGFGGPGAEGASFFTLEGVMALFTRPHAVLAGWLHYLAFDLFVGAWQARDARRHGLPQIVVVPSLLLTLMLGPAGLLLYAVTRGVMRRRWRLDETG